MLNLNTSSQGCPQGFTGNITLTCVGGYATKGEDTCVPLPCPVGTSSNLTFDEASGLVTTQAAYAHNQSYTEQCASVNSGYTGTFQVRDLKEGRFFF